MLIDIYESEDGLVILGNFLDTSILQAIEDSAVSKFSLVVLIYDESFSVEEYLKIIERFCAEGSMVYVFGKNSERNKRPLHKLVVKAEASTRWTFNNMISGSSFGEVACFYLEGMKEDDSKPSRITGRKRKIFGSKKWFNPAKILDSFYEKYGMDKLLEMLIKSHTKKGEWIFDPTSKKGQIAKIAHKFNRRFVSIEDDCEDFVHTIESIENS